MRCNFLVLTVVGFLALCGICSNANAQEDVYVDLSVLDGLQDFDSSDVAAQPLFPQVKKTIKATKLKPAKKIVKATKIIKAKNKVVEVKVKPLSEAEQLALDDKKRADLVSKKLEVVEPKAEMVEEVYDVKDDVLDVVSPVKEENLVIPSTVSAVNMENVNANETPLTPIVESESLNTTLINRPSAPEVKVIDETIATTPAMPTMTETLPSVVSEPVLPEATPVLPESKVETIVEPIIPSVPAILKASSVDKQLYFDADDAPLSDANKQKIDTILSSFVDVNNNKIAILSYNLDDGQEVFKKKRLSLNRAIEIRKYLLEKGYKNFSIKVVNVVDEPNKKNLVEIEEII